MTDPWRTAHIYLHCSPESVSSYLVDHVVPLIGAAAPGDWHFLRYWWGGPHVRVRMRGVSPEAHASWVEQVRKSLPPADIAIDQEEFERAFTSASPVPWRPHGTIDVGVPYEPEVERYGGAAALPLSEHAFTASSDIAALLLAERPDQSTLRMVGVDIMLLALDALGLDDLAGARSARRYFGSWDFVGESPSDGPAARRAAEESFAANPQTWKRRRSAVVGAAAAKPDSWRGRVSVLLRDLVSGLSAIEERGEQLASPLVAIVWSQVHMLCNRLSIPVADERVAAWLTGLAWPGWPLFDFFDEDGNAPDRSYLRSSAYRRAEMDSSQAPRSRMPGGHPASGWVSGEPIDLPAETVSADLGSILERRKSSYGDFGGQLATSLLGTLLNSAAGVVPARTTEKAGRTLLYRAYPSASAAYAVEAFVVAREVEAVTPGTYRYDAVRHALEPRLRVPAAEELAAWSPFIGSGDGAIISVDRLPAILVLVAHLGDLREKYGQRALRLALLESGHISQNIGLVATALGMPNVPLSGYDDDALSEFLHLDGSDDFVSAVLPIGAPSS